MLNSDEPWGLKWQPIETWDRKNKWVVLFQPESNSRNYRLDARVVMPGYEGNRNTTHWMPLPAPPTEG